jgi:Zn-dependent M28 family amino/carboxypeptidase
VAVLARLGFEAKRQPYGTEGGENVYAVLRCGRPGAEALVLGAHYDSVRQGPGANDDATGVAAVVLVAAEMRRTTGRTRDLYFVFFDEEERGLRGSRAFAQMLAEEKRAIFAVHTIDQMGWDSNHNRAIELELPYEGVNEVYQAAAKALHMPIVIYTTTEAGSDHSAFRRLGFKAVGLTEEYRHKDTTPFIHRAGDTFPTVDFAYLGGTTRLVVEVMKRLTSARG